MQTAILAQADSLAAYAAELLRTWGLLGGRIVTGDRLLPLDPASVPVVICAPGNPEARLHAPLLQYVRAGGSIIAFAPQADWAQMLGLQAPRPKPTPQRLRLTARPAAGLDGELLPVVGTVLEYDWPTGTEPIGYLSTPASYRGESLGIGAWRLGAGKILVTAFDLPRCVLLLRQGDPRRAEALPDGDPCARPSHLACQFDAGDAAWVPFADLMARWLVDQIRWAMAAPVPLLWHLPEGAAGLLLFSGDEDHAELAWNRDQMEHLEGCGARMNLYIIPERTRSSPADVQGYRRHHDVGPHPDLRHLDRAPVAARLDELDRQIRLFEARYAVKARSLRNHCTAWAGYLEPVEVMARLGVRMDANYFSGAFGRDRLQAPYATFGGALPMRFCWPGGRLLPVFQQHTPLADDILFGAADYSYKLTPAAFGAMSARILDDMVRRFHTPFAVCVHPSNWVRFSGEQGRRLLADARQRGVPTWSCDQWLCFWEARDTWQSDRARWDGRSLEWTASGSHSHPGLVLAVPAAHGPLRLGAVSLAPAAASPVPITRVWRYRQEWALVPVPAGRLTVQLRACYQ